MAKNKNAKVLRGKFGPKPWQELSAAEREALKQKKAVATDTNKK